MTLAAIGVVGFICNWVSFELLIDGVPPFWFQLILLVALALVPVGFVTAVIGGAVWAYRKAVSRDA